MSKQSFFEQSSLVQAIQFREGTKFSSIWPIDRTLSGTTNPGQSRLSSDEN